MEHSQSIQSGHYFYYLKWLSWLHEVNREMGDGRREEGHVSGGRDRELTDVCVTLCTLISTDAPYKYTYFFYSFLLTAKITCTNLHLTRHPQQVTRVSGVSV